MKPELQGRRVVVGVCGGIAAYKVCEVVSTLAKAGAEVRVVLTETAQAFVSALTFATLSRRPAYTNASFWQPSQGRPLHIDLGEWADLIVVAPLTANTLAKLVWGNADNLLTNLVLASRCPLLLVPAMNNVMWAQPVVQRNWQQVQQDDRVHVLPPQVGMLACTPVGTPVEQLESGRMAEPDVMVGAIASLLHAQGQRDLQGLHLVVSAGGTREHLDPVRFIGNPSSGKMGVALALAAGHRGARVTLVHAPLSQGLPTLQSIEPVPVVSAAEMAQAIVHHATTADWIVMAAAVADVRPCSTASTKLPKQELPRQLPLEVVPDILTMLGEQKRSDQRLIGFAAQTGDIVTPAIAKLQRKQLDGIVANPIDVPAQGFGSDWNQATLISRQGQPITLAPCSKRQLAHHILDWIKTLA